MSSSTVETIKERLGIAELVGSYLKLEKAGQNFRALCPFHKEKTPSFMVSPTRGSYYCFGCGAKGDIFSFVEAFEGVEFTGALKLLAERTGIPLERQAPKEREEGARRYALMEEAARFYEGMFAKHPEAKSYLAARGLSEKSMSFWRVGYAPQEWRALTEHLRAKGYQNAELEALGLAKRKEGASDYYDRFRSRIMFPINDASGRATAFSGRIFPDDPTAAKYLNSPETPLFHKSNVLFGFDKAKGAIRKFDFSVLVEGQMDTLLVSQGGFPNVIGISGTALTEHHLMLLGRFSKRMVIALDADAAGIASAGKGAALALSKGFDVKVAALPEGKDPADLVAENPERFKEAVRGAKHIVEFYLGVLRRRSKDERSFRKDAEALVLPFVARIESPIDRAHFIKLAASELGVAEDSVREALARIPKEGESKADEAAPQRGKHTRRDTVLDELFGLLLAEGPEADTVREGLKGILGESFEKLHADALSRSEELSFRAELLKDTSPETLVVSDLLAALERELLEEALSATAAELRSAERDQDEARLKAAHAESDRITKKLASLHRREK